MNYLKYKIWQDVFGMYLCFFSNPYKIYAENQNLLYIDDRHVHCSVQNVLLKMYKILNLLLENVCHFYSLEISLSD